MVIGARTAEFRTQMSAAGGPQATLKASTEAILKQNGAAASITTGFSETMSEFAEELMANNAAHQVLGKLLGQAKSNMQTILGAV